MKVQQYRTFYILSGIIVLTCLLYFNSLNNDLTSLDDDRFITNNEDVKSLTGDNIELFFTKQYLGHYFPVTILTYALNYSISGLNPFSYHLFNLIFHLFNIILVFFFIFKLTGKSNGALIVSLLFAIHPMSVESVAWISARSSVLFTFFYLFSVICYIIYVQKGRKNIWLLMSLCLFLFSLLCKSAAITLPLLLLLIDYYLSGKSVRIIEKVPYFILSAVFGVAAILSAKAFGSYEYSEKMYSAWDNIFIIFYQTDYYIIKLLFPFHLSAIHANPLKTGGYLPFQFYLSVVFILLIIFGIIKTKSFRKELIFGLLFFLITIFVVLRIFSVGTTIVSERYTYLPYIGLFFIIGRFYDNLFENRMIMRKLSGKILMVLLFGFVIFFSVKTTLRNKVWQDSITLFTDVVSKYPKRDFGYYARGIARSESNDVISAIDDYNKTIRLNPAHDMAYNNRGCMRHLLKDYKHAILDFDSAIVLNNEQDKAYFNRGRAKAELKDYKAAIMDFDKTIIIDPSNSKAFLNRGNMKFRLRNKDGACKDWKKALELGFKDVAQMIRKYCR